MAPCNGAVSKQASLDLGCLTVTAVGTAGDFSGLSGVTLRLRVVAVFPRDFVSTPPSPVFPVGLFPPVFCWRTSSSSLLRGGAQEDSLLFIRGCLNMPQLCCPIW